MLGLAPSIVGLRYSYVKLSPRLFYSAAPGTALLWVCSLTGELNYVSINKLFSRLWRAGGRLALGLIGVQSILLLNGFRQTYAVGIRHMEQLINVAQSSDDNLLFVNFPDRYVPKHPPYPLGYWGVTLAQIAMDLGAFPAITTGIHPHTISLQMPALDMVMRESGPYQTDMRGEVTTAGQLYRLAHQADGVYLSRYLPDGSFRLYWAGNITSTTLPSLTDPTTLCQRAVFSQTLCLQDIEATLYPDHLSITLTWLSLAPAHLHDTVFAHLGTADHPPVAQSDDDLWLGMLPLHVLQPGDIVREQRLVQLPAEVAWAENQIRLGVYNRESGKRLPAWNSQGERLADDAYVVEAENLIRVAVRQTE